MSTRNTSEPDDNNIAPDNGRGRSSSGSPLLIILFAFILLFALSLVEWADITNDKVKKFNLFADIIPEQNDETKKQYDEFIDDILADIEDDDDLTNPAVFTAGPGLSIDSINAVTRVSEADTAAVPSPGPVYGTDVADKASLVNGQIVIEDYTSDQSGLGRLKNALASSASRPARIAVMGDSYIEGDIITQDLRRMLQSAYGGRGVGYVAANSKVASFRQSVSHRASGWTEHQIQQASRSPYFTIAGDYYTGSNGATITLKGTKSQSLKAWNTSRILFFAPADGTITLTDDSGTHTFEVSASDMLQSLDLAGETTSLTVKSNVPGLVFLGTWINDDNGVVVDNMSIRGDSGIPRAKVSQSLAAQMRQYVDYDLIILEFGINALSDKQSDYTNYGKQMLKVIQRVKECYPNADILLLGIGDRGQKVNGVPHSYATAKNMVEAQRNAAKSAQILFWDTRQAMGGEDAIVNWRNNKLANADFIHLNHNGGAVLADSLFNSIQRILK